MMTIEERLKQAEEQLAYWAQQREFAERQWWSWQGAVEALKGIDTRYEIRDTSEEGKGAEEVSAGS